MEAADILRIAKSRGEFIVSWKYRDYRKFRRCKKLEKQGVLMRVRSQPGISVFKYIGVDDAPS